MGALAIVCLLYYIADHMLAVLMKPFIIETLRSLSQTNNHSFPGSSNTTELTNITWSSIVNRTSEMLDAAFDPTESLNVSNETMAVLSYWAREHGNLSDQSPLTVEEERRFDAQEGEYTTLGRQGLLLMLDWGLTYIPGMVLSPICGVWSDSHGQKVPLLLPLVGHVTSVLLYVTSDHWPGGLLTTVILGALLKGLLGKGAVFSMALTTLVANTTPASQLSKENAHIMAFRFMGICLGSIMAALMAHHCGIALSLLTTGIIQVVCFIIGFLGVKNPVMTLDDVQVSSSDRTQTPHKSQFNLKNVQEKTGYLRSKTGRRRDTTDERACLVEKVTSREEDSSARKVLIVAVLVVTFMTQAVSIGQTEVIALTTSVPPLSWPSSWFGYIHMAYFGAGGLFLQILVPCLHKLKWAKHHKNSRRSNKASTTGQKNASTTTNNQAKESIRLGSVGSRGPNGSTPSWGERSVGQSLRSEGEGSTPWGNGSASLGEGSASLGNESTSLLSSGSAILTKGSAGSHLPNGSAAPGCRGEGSSVSPGEGSAAACAGSAVDEVLLLVSVVSSAVSSVWVGLASHFASSWQIFAAFLVGALVCTSASCTRSLLSRAAGSRQQGRLMAALSMLEVLAKVLWPMLHTAIYLHSLPAAPSLTYYLLGGEATLLLPLLYLIHRLMARVQGPDDDYDGDESSDSCTEKN